MTGRIAGTGFYAPEKVVTNDDLAKIMDTSDEWIRDRSGIAERHIATCETTVGMAAKAAERALESSGIEAGDIEVIIVATNSPDNYYPAAACEVQAAIGARNAAAFDIFVGCSGFVTGMSILNAYIQAGLYRTGLVIGSETLSKMMDWDDRSTCVLFGDAAGAAVITASDTGIEKTILGADGSQAEALTCVARVTDNFLDPQPHVYDYTHMDGKAVFKFAVRKMADLINELLEESGEDAGNIKYFLVHQANLRIIEAAAKRLGIPMERFPHNIETYGNTSTASIPVLLTEMSADGRLQKGDKIILAAFGAGLTWAGALLTW